MWAVHYVSDTYNCIKTGGKKATVLEALLPSSGIKYAQHCTETINRAAARVHPLAAATVPVLLKQ